MPPSGLASSNHYQRSAVHTHTLSTCAHAQNTHACTHARTHRTHTHAQHAQRCTGGDMCCAAPWLQSGRATCCVCAWARGTTPRALQPGLLALRPQWAKLWRSGASNLGCCSLACLRLCCRHQGGAPCAFHASKPEHAFLKHTIFKHALFKNTSFKHASFKHAIFKCAFGVRA